ncbi:hypothetical protein TVAG_486540 [Trichomonas vaginalis G3]|uniref:Uncharacterized protein n=1 Tax=Trichomonas vaginalis (strain ATCC PRA-98 / G3) TaxID=412133 RepID=A2GBD3_TRIV3|nr:hypothetical protein TVAGG3_1007120 [Trichomonas vaginalis G3]EAX85537.1 hypothetical protein TVAG_486540 [Trichomonas vaginalis G3]KAI5491213.1 hypothetical protein TVAGG3_1007120 [Trichomonas vaginalis G3]|eukprot:XP_001298467.1 hypothetical protein [Trichomonas vaginalis G3]
MSSDQDKLLNELKKIDQDKLLKELKKIEQEKLLNELKKSDISIYQEYDSDRFLKNPDIINKAYQFAKSDERTKDRLQDPSNFIVPKFPYLVSLNPEHMSSIFILFPGFDHEIKRVVHQVVLVEIESISTYEQIFQLFDDKNGQAPADMKIKKLYPNLRIGKILHILDCDVKIALLYKYGKVYRKIFYVYSPSFLTDMSPENIYLVGEEYQDTKFVSRIYTKIDLDATFPKVYFTEDYQPLNCIQVIPYAIYSFFSSCFRSSGNGYKKIHMKED